MSNSFASEAPRDRPSEPDGYTIVQTRGYYHNKYKIDTTKPCTGIRCFNTGTDIYCSKYDYVKSWKTTYQFCNVSKFKPLGGKITPVTSGRKITILTGFTAPNPKGVMVFTAGVPADTFFEADLDGKLILPKPLPEVPRTVESNKKKTEADVGCKNKDCEVGNITKLAIDTKKVTDPIESKAKKKPSLGEIKKICNRNQSADSCQLCNCYHESRGESFSGKIAVIRTVLARAKSKGFPGSGSICSVIYAPAQFSWTTDRVNNDISTSEPGSVEAFGDCEKALVIAKKRGPGTGYFYNPKKAAPKWARKMKVCATIDNHRFVTPQSVTCPANLAGISIPKIDKNMLYSIVEGIK